MDAVLITLLATLPIIAVGVIVWLWIQRSSTPAIAERKKAGLYLIVGLPAALYMLHGLLGFVQPYRYIVGISTVVLANDSGSQLDNVELMMHAPNNHYTHRFHPFAHRRERFSVRASELTVTRVAFSLGPQSVASTNVARIKRGQTLTVRIDPPGKVTKEID